MKRTYIEYVILVIIGLTPLLWFKGGFLITGGDINFSLDPAQEFLRRTQAWDGVYQGGRDNAINFATLFFVGVQALFYVITHSLIWTEKLSFVFWFMLMGFSMYCLTATLLFKNSNFIVKIATCIFYQFNFYQLACWSGVHIAGITALAALPVFFCSFVRILKGESNLKNFLVFSIFSIVSGGILVNLPTFIVFSFIFIAFLILYFLRINNWLEFRKAILKCIIMGSVYIMLNAYILLPLINSYFGAVEGSPIEDYNVIKYAGFQSEYSSVLNVIRLMGNNEWYASWTNGEYYFPFFQEYILRRLFIMGSFILPILVFLGAFLKRQNRYAQFFMGISAIGIVLSMGMHPPMSGLYKWMLQNVPLFFMFRSPWLKFTFLTAFSYSILAGFCCLWVDEFFRRIFRKFIFIKNFIPDGFILCIVSVYLFFMHSFLFGEMFTAKDKRLDLNPLHVKVPEYIFSSADWINQKKGEFSLALLPDERSNVYEWGYGGVKDISLEFLKKKTIYREYGEMGAVPCMAGMYSLFTLSLYNELTYNIEQFLNLIGIRYIIQRNDIRFYFYGDRDSPRFIKDIINKQKEISLEKRFGQMDIYINKKWEDNYINLKDYLIWIKGDIKSLLCMSDLSHLMSTRNVFIIEKKEKAITNYVRKYNKANGIKIFANPKSKYINCGYKEGLLFYRFKDEFVLNRLGKEVHVLSDRVYDVFIKLKPKFTELVLRGSNRVVFVPKDIIEWRYKPNKTSYSKKISEDIFLLDAFFDGNSKEDEYVQIKKEGVDIDLERYPWFMMDYKLDEPGIQIIEFIFGIDVNGDGKADGTIRGFRTTDPTKGWKTFKMDLLNTCINRLLPQKMYKIVLIELYCHKYWGVDCSRLDTKRDYRFFIKNIMFSSVKKKEMAEVCDYKLKYYPKDIRFKILDLTKKCKRVRVPIPRYDLLKYNEIKFKYRLKYPARVEVFEIFLRLYSKTDKEKEKLVFLNRVPIENKYKEFRINLLWYGDKLHLWKDYYIKDIEFKIWGSKLRGDIKDILKLKNIKIFRSHFINAWQKGNYAYKLLKIGKQIISYTDCSENFAIPKEIVISKSVDLKKRWNALKLLLNGDDFLKCQWICILPGIRYNGNESSPISKYKKIDETFYRVNIENGDNSFALIMSNNYNPKWRAYVLKKPETRNQKPECRELKEHFIANGFANGWLVDKFGDNMEILIKYYPQKLFWIGVWISSATILLCAVMYFLKNIYAKKSRI